MWNQKKIAAVLAVVVAAVTFAASESQALSIERPRPNEPITLVKVLPSEDKKGVDLHLKAFFGGCGSSDDFTVDVTNRNGQQRVRVVRLHADPCELYAPDGKLFTLRTDKLDLSKPFYVDLLGFTVRAYTPASEGRAFLAFNEGIALTNGRRATDPYELFAEFEPSDVPGEWETRFFARSMRYLAHVADVEALEPGQRLFCMCDVQNPADPNAVAFRTEYNAIVGFFPAYLVDEIVPLLNAPENAVVLTVERVNRAPAPLQHRLQCLLRVRPREDFHAYRRGRYVPISAQVSISPAEAGTPYGTYRTFPI